MNCAIGGSAGLYSSTTWSITKRKMTGTSRSKEEQKLRRSQRAEDTQERSAETVTLDRSEDPKSDRPEKDRLLAVIEEVENTEPLEHACECRRRLRQLWSGAHLCWRRVLPSRLPHARRTPRHALDCRARGGHARRPARPARGGQVVTDARRARLSRAARAAPTLDRGSCYPDRARRRRSSPGDR